MTVRTQNQIAEQEPGLETSLWQDACLSLELISLMVGDGIAANPPGIRIKAHAGPVREALMQRLEAIVSKTVFHKMPIGIDEQKLLGGLDLSATLDSGKKIAEKGLLARCDNEMLILPMANLIASEVISQITSAMDYGHVKLERDGFSKRENARFGLVVFDESDEGDPPFCEALSDRLMFHLDLTPVSFRALEKDSRPQRQSPAVSAVCESRLVEELCALALSFGLTSMRPVQQALRIAMLHARLAGRQKVEQEDIVVAVRLSLLNRARHLPQPPQDIEEEEAPPEPENPLEDQQEDNRETGNSEETPPEEMSVEALMNELPDGLLEQLAQGLNSANQTLAQGRKGKVSQNEKRGRPLASRRGKLRTGQTLDLMATLRAAVPWQKVRAQEALVRETTNAAGIYVRPSDFHIRRFKQNTDTSTVFVVDASGSTALNRLGEAKGAVEGLLAEGYARRDHVSLVSFRKREAEVLLSPTRSLVRAKKSLAHLPGGGGTPLASGLQKAFMIASEEARNGRMASIVLMTDGSANVDLDGKGGRAKAMQDANQVARMIAENRLPCMVIDVSRIPSKNAKALAATLSATYIPMPFASSKNLSDAVKAGR